MHDFGAPFAIVMRHYAPPMRGIVNSDSAKDNYVTQVAGKILPKACLHLYGQGIGASVSIHAHRSHYLRAVRAVAKIRVFVGDLVHYIHALRHFAKGRICAVEVRCVGVHDEKLASRAVGIGSARHGNDSAFVTQIVAVVAVLFELALNAVTRSACAVSERTAPLDHKSAYDAVKGQAVVKTAVCKRNEIVDRVGRNVGKQFQRYLFAVFHCDDCRGITCIHTFLLFPCRRERLINCVAFIFRADAKFAYVTIRFEQASANSNVLYYKFHYLATTFC